MGVDAPHRLERERRDRRGVLAAAGVRGDVGELEELASRMRPAQRLGDRLGIPVCGVEFPEAAVGVGLQDAVPPRQVRLRMLTPPVAGEAEQRGGRGVAGEGAVVADMDPEPGRRGFPARQERHGGVVAVQPLGGHDMSSDQRMQRRQRRGGGADLVGERERLSSTPSRA